MEQTAQQANVAATERMVSVTTHRDQRIPAVWEQALHTGLNMGLILAGLNIVNWLAGLAAGGAFDAQVEGGIVANRTIGMFAFSATCFLFLARLALFFAAGHRVATRTGNVAFGALAGMVAGAVDGVSGLIITLLGVALFPMYTLTSGYSGSTQPVGGAILIALVETVALSVVGLLLGGLGGGTTESDRYHRPA